MRCFEYLDRRMLRKLFFYWIIYGGCIRFEEYCDVKVLLFGILREEFELF